MILKICRINQNAKMPTKAYDGDACWDVYSAQSVTIWPGSTKLVSTGIRMNIPKGYYVDIRPRSGLYTKNQIMIANTPGTIDCGYLNQVFIAIRNLSGSSFKVQTGMKIAQFKLQKLYQYQIQQIGQQQFNQLQTQRGLNGFGSSDKADNEEVK